MPVTDFDHSDDTSSPDSRLATIDLNRLVEGMRPLLARIAGSFIRLNLALDPMELLVPADRDQIEPALLSLVVSASDAMPLGGALQISTRRWQLSETHSHLHGEIPAGLWVVLRVSHTGTRLEAVAIARLLGEESEPTMIPRPPLSTDLSRVAAVVRAAAGHILIEQSGEAGTAIALCLPARASAAAPTWPAWAAPAVLVVDSDPWLRRTTALVLRRAGYGVLEADHGSGALELLGGITRSCIRLMLVDVDLPGGEAEALVRGAHERCGDLDILYVGRPRAGWNEDLLTKPFTPGELLAAVVLRLGSPAPQ